jgi:hypothetical protein
MKLVNGSSMVFSLIITVNINLSEVLYCLILDGRNYYILEELTSFSFSMEMKKVRLVGVL